MNRVLKYRIDQVIYWIAVITPFTGAHLYLIRNLNWFYYLEDILAKTFALAFVIYLVIYLIEKEYQEGKFTANGLIKILAISILLICLYTFLETYNTYFLEGLMRNFYDWRPFTFRLFYSAANCLIFLLLALSIHFTKKWYYQKEQIHTIKIQSLQNELNYLRSQLQPHFIFNSLNTVFGLIDKDNTKARDTLLLFADLMRYNLYEANLDSITLEKELEYIQNYIDLQKRRSENALAVKVNLEATNAQSKIAPLLFMPIIENAFKYAGSREPKDAYIHVGLIETESMIRFACQNSKKSNSLQKGIKTGGIGISNVKRRLELLYPGKHQITITDEPHFFDVSIQLGI